MYFNILKTFLTSDLIIYQDLLHKMATEISYSVCELWNIFQRNTRSVNFLRDK
jgi:hypothetical protein